MVETNPFIIEGYFSLCDKFLEQSLKEKELIFVSKGNNGNRYKQQKRSFRKRPFLLLTAHWHGYSSRC